MMSPLTKGLLTALGVMLICTVVPVAQVFLAPFGPFLGAYFGIRDVDTSGEPPLLAAAKFGAVIGTAAAAILVVIAVILTAALAPPAKFVILTWIAVVVFSAYVAVMSTLGGLYRLMKQRTAAQTASAGADQPVALAGGEGGALATLLENVRDGRMAVSDALAALRDLPYQDLGYARLDHHRPLRTGWPEVVLAEGKTAEQTAGIVAALAGRGHPVLVTRAASDVHDAVAAAVPTAQYHELARCIVVPPTVHEIRQPVAQREVGLLVLTGGTADLPVAEEATITAQLMGCQVKRISDVGVAGLHRLLAQRESLQAARVIVVVAGMEAALASVVSGLVSAPVIAVPTSVGYGASFGGMAALLGMLNSCAPGVAVVNIDNGFGAGYLAAQICLMSLRSESADV